MFVQSRRSSESNCQNACSPAPQTRVGPRLGRRMPLHRRRGPENKVHPSPTVFGTEIGPRTHPSSSQPSAAGRRLLRIRVEFPSSLRGTLVKHGGTRAQVLLPRFEDLPCRISQSVTAQQPPEEYSIDPRGACRLPDLPLLAAKQGVRIPALRA